MPPRSRPLAPPYPFPGGRRRHADFALECEPEYFGGYVEPFLGGGAVAIAFMERHPEVPFRLSSDDSELIVTWQVLQTHVDRLVRLVGAHREHHDRAHRVVVEAQRGEALLSLPPSERAARFIYLQGSTPDREAVVFDEVNVRGVARLLQNRDATFTEQHFFSVVRSVGEEELVYFDPPFSKRPADDVLRKETRSLVNTITARGAYLLAPASPVYEGWPTMSVVADRGDGDALWANGTLVRALRR